MLSEAKRSRNTCGCFSKGSTRLIAKLESLVMLSEGRAATAVETPVVAFQECSISRFSIFKTPVMLSGAKRSRNTCGCF